MCTATVTGTTEQPNITWSGPGVTAGMITTTGSMSTLTFNPLAASHAGTYTCTGMVGGVTVMDTSVVTVNSKYSIINNLLTMCVVITKIPSTSTAPSIVVMVSDDGATPSLGQSYTLTCSVTGANNINPTITYQWTKNNGTQTQVVGTNSNTLSLSPLRLSDTGQYTCSVTVSSTLISSVITATSTALDISIPSKL